MIIYLVVIFLSAISIALLNIFFNPLCHKDWWVYIIATIAFIILAFLIDAFVAIIIRKMPEKYFSKNKGIFKTSERELRFYRFLRVNKWKDHIPELGGFTNFHKDKLVDPFSNEYIGRYILEARYGIAIHIFSVPASFLIILCDYKMYLGLSNLWLTIALPVAIINAILIVLPAFILKYNMPRLIRIYENNIKLKEKENR